MFNRFKILDDTTSFHDLKYFTSDELHLYKYRHFYNLGKYEEMVISEPSTIFGKKDQKYHMTLCHFPISIWNHKQHGAMMLTGHSHGNFEQSNLQSTDSKILDVGVDNAIKYNGNCVFNWNDIKKIMNKKTIQNLDHH
jgi:hypothetical protein